MKKMNKKGFTLVEMLVVIAIIAILVAILIPTVTGATTKAKEAADVANIRSAVAEYEVKVLSGQTATWAEPANLNYGSSSTTNKYSYADATKTITYASTKLGDGNSAKTYTWTLGDMEG